MGRTLITLIQLLHSHVISLNMTELMSLKQTFDPELVNQLAAFTIDPQIQINDKAGRLLSNRSGCIDFFHELVADHLSLESLRSSVSTIGHILRFDPLGIERSLATRLFTLC